ncbi:peptide-methionine (S)-S-oxide reductase MsrA [Reinekea marinisedimentorum]|nr:peptide-methionine (S)-S-oxide reductase MsrA [Reinekea marinisedimentorum]
MNLYELTRTPLPGRAEAMPLDSTHAVLGTDMTVVPQGFETLWLGLGCFWGAERLFWKLPGVYSTAVGYAGGITPNPTYEEVCSGQTGHAEVVQIVYNPEEITLAELLAEFWQAHDPTQGLRQGNDIGAQYRSAVYGSEAQLAEATKLAQVYQQQLKADGYCVITTEVKPMGVFYYAEQYHQQYLHKNPTGYCGLKGTGVVCPI